MNREPNVPQESVEELKDDQRWSQKWFCGELLQESVLLIPPDNLAVLLDMGEDGGEHGDQEVEQHHIRNQHVDSEEDFHHRFIGCEVFTEHSFLARHCFLVARDESIVGPSLLIADLLIAGHNVLYVEFAQHLPDGDEAHIMYYLRNIGDIEAVVRVEQSLPCCSIAQDEDHDKQEEGGDLWEHSVQDDKLGSQL